MTYAMCGRLGCRHHDGDGCTLETVDLVTSPVIGVPHCKDFEVVGDVRRAQPGADPIDLVKRDLGELRRYKQELADARGSRDHWRKLAGEREDELEALKSEMAARWVKLPTDTSGETIRHGDLLVDSDGVTFRANELVLRDSGWMLRYMGEDVLPEDTIHAEEELTEEGVLTDFGAEMAASGETVLLDEQYSHAMRLVEELHQVLSLNGGGYLDEFGSREG